MISSRSSQRTQQKSLKTYQVFKPLYSNSQLIAGDQLTIALSLRACDIPMAVTFFSAQLRCALVRRLLQASSKLENDSVME
jgi:hypothetical protein